MYISTENKSSWKYNIVEEIVYRDFFHHHWALWRRKNYLMVCFISKIRISINIDRSCFWLNQWESHLPVWYFQKLRCYEKETIGHSVSHHHPIAAGICVNSLPATIALHEQCKRKLFSLFEVDELVAIAFLVHIFIYGQMSKMSAKVNILLSPIINCIIALPFSYSKRKKKSEHINLYTDTFICMYYFMM